jgi:predicted transcriptional regulator
MVKIERINLEKEGLIKFFSPNEARLLELLWKNKKMTSPEIQQECNDLSLACVAGTLDRLIKSGFVHRKIDETESRLRYIYSPVGNRENVGNKICERIIDCLADTFGTSTIDKIKKDRKKVNKNEYY